LIARVASARVQPDLRSCASASAVSSTARGDQDCAAGPLPRAASAAWAISASPPAISARSRASTRSSSCSRVSPVCDFAVRVSRVACWDSRSRSNPFGARPYRASKASISSVVFAVTLCRRVEISDIACGETPTISRDLPSGRIANTNPSVVVSRSSVVRSATAAAAGRNRWIARESSVRHVPSGHSTRLRIGLCTCNCGSCSRESC
jgi:hypothetical protein